MVPGDVWSSTLRFRKERAAPVTRRRIFAAADALEGQAATDPYSPRRPRDMDGMTGAGARVTQGVRVLTARPEPTILRRRIAALGRLERGTHRA